jgi:ribosomal protein S18 acetylase RimI-like enzyme
MWSTMNNESAIAVEVATHVDEALVGAVGRLVPQLSSSTPPPSRVELEIIVAGPSTMLLLARSSRAVVGMLTLAIFRIPTGIRAWIEDVVVDTDARGQGVGEALTREAVRIAGTHGARTVELTSRPSREAANRLYQRLGFERRDTNVYRFAIGK